MAAYKLIVKDINEAGGAEYKEGEPVILVMRLNYIPRQHDVFKYNGNYYEVIRIISDLSDPESSFTMVVRKYVI